jgi:hypothetical protein
MKEEYIRDFNKVIIGIIQTDAEGNQTGRLFNSRKIVGYYTVKDNRTRNFLLQIVSEGNTLVNLIYKELGR